MSQIRTITLSVMQNHGKGDEAFVDELEQAIKDYIAKEINTPTHIMGKPIDEVCGILSMLDMERLAEMNLTMANLKKWQELLLKEQMATFEKTIATQRQRLEEADE